MEGGIEFAPMAVFSEIVAFVLGIIHLSGKPAGGVALPLRARATIGGTAMLGAVALFLALLYLVLAFQSSAGLDFVLIVMCSVPPLLPVILWRFARRH